MLNDVCRDLALRREMQELVCLHSRFYVTAATDVLYVLQRPLLHNANSVSYF